MGAGFGAQAAGAAAAGAVAAPTSAVASSASRPVPAVNRLHQVPRRGAGAGCIPGTPSRGGVPPGRRRGGGMSADRRSEQLPEMVRGAVVVVLDDMGAVGGGHPVHAEHLVRVAVADAVRSRRRRGTSCHRWSAVSLSSNCTTWALFAVDMRSTPSTLPECWLRIRYQPSPLATSRHRWSAVPVSPNWTTWALFAVDMLVHAEHLAGVAGSRSGTRAGRQPGSASGPTVGKDVIRSRAAPIGTSVTSSTGSVDGVGLSCSGATTCSSSALHSGILRAAGGDPDRRGAPG